MIDVCTIFEEWYPYDGIYPMLHCGEKVNLSFCINPHEVKVAAGNEAYFTQLKHDEYSFCGEVIYSHDNGYIHLIVLNVGDFKFFIDYASKSDSMAIGQFVSGVGNLELDDGIWIQRFSKYENAPNIFCNLMVDKILMVKIPEQFISRDEKGNVTANVTFLSPSQYTDSDITEIDNMDMVKVENVFYLLYLKPINENIEKTYRL